MRGALAAMLRNLVLPYGAVSGGRIVLDGDAGSIKVYDTSGAQEVTIDPAGIALYGSHLDLDTYQTYTCTWSSTGTAPSIGGGSITARFMYLNKHNIRVTINVDPGIGASKGTGEWRFSLPFAVLGIGPGTWWANDSGAAYRCGSVVGVSSTTVALYADGAGAAAGAAMFTGTFVGSSILLDFDCRV